MKLVAKIISKALIKGDLQAYIVGNSSGSVILVSRYELLISHIYELNVREINWKFNFVWLKSPGVEIEPGDPIVDMEINLDNRSLMENEINHFSTFFTFSSEVQFNGTVGL
jgi:hypothetical protein